MCTCINTSKHLQKARTINSMRRHPKYSAYWLLVHRVLGKVRLGFTISLFSRLRDHGAEIIPQLLMLMSYLNIMKIWINKDDFKSTYLINIIIFLH